MRLVIYYSLMLLLLLAWYKLGQNLLRKGPRDENGDLTAGFFGPMGFLVCSLMGCYLFFALVRALVRGEVPCLGRGCGGQIYTLAAHAADYWSGVFYLSWFVLALGYAVYVTFKIWSRI